jgi:heme-degrading monooxygenase HmoA
MHVFVVVWRYRVPAASVAAFERAYGPDGAWVELFQRHAGFLGTELVRGDEPGTYLSIDRWTSAAAYEACLRDAKDEYRRLDAVFAALTDEEALVVRGTLASRSASASVDVGLRR